MNKMQKQYEVLHRASLFLEQHHREPRVAEILLIHHLHVSRSEFFMRMQEPVPEDVFEKFKADIKKHAETGIPVQHLTGYEEFYGRSFLVNENVLVPRPETEELVLHVVNEAKKMDKPLTIVDIGTGSGVIAITLALELPNATVYATDISEAALTVAKENAAQLNKDVNFLQGDFLSPIIEQNVTPDIIVSNPPYIAWDEQETLSETVKNFDPKLALFAEENGLAAYRKIIAQAKEFPSANMLAFEIGQSQAAAVQSLLEQTFPGSLVQTKKDINGKDRIVSAFINK